MNYIIKRSDSIQHAASTAPRRNAKYVARVPIHQNGKDTWRYFYTNEEYQAYLRGDKKITEKPAPKEYTKTVNPGDKTKTATVEEKTSKGKFSLKNVLKAASSNIEKSVENGKNAVDNIIKGIDTAIDNKVEQIKKEVIETVEKTIDKTPEVANKIVDKVTEVANEVYDDKDNMYDVNPMNYDKKIAKIAETPEWKAIVESKNPEYVRKNADGTTSYLIDDYLAKKKMPVMDVLDDIVSQRPITVNEIEKDAVVAGIKQQVFGKISLGVLAAGALTKFMIEKTKVSQGSYNDEIEEFTNKLVEGKKYVDDVLETASNVSNDMTHEDAQEILKLIQTSKKITADTKDVSNNISATKNNINEVNVIEAAKLLLNSDKMPDEVIDSVQYKKAEQILSSLSDEEIALVNALVNSVMKNN